MKNKRIILLYLMLFVYITINNLMMQSKFVYYNSVIISPFLLFVITIIAYFLLPTAQKRIKYKYEKNQNVIIIIFLYLIIYFISGLIFGYSYSIYSKDLLTLIKNIYSVSIIIVLSEYIRNKLVVNSSDNYINNVLISIALILITFNFSYFFRNIYPFSVGFKYIASQIIPNLVISFTLTYLSRKCGLISTLICNLSLGLIAIILPILPNISWIILSILKIVLAMFLYFNINYFELMYDRKYHRYLLNKNTKSTTILFIIVIILIMFILKFFKYYPISILSDSMKNTFSRGDIAIIEKLDRDYIEEIQVNDIIYYKKNNKLIIHRIVNIEIINNRMVITTKGDNNDDIDPWKVYEEEIIGIVKGKIPFLGYPAVWLNEAFND